MMAAMQKMSCMNTNYASAQSADAAFSCTSCAGMQSASNTVVMILDAIIMASIIICGIIGLICSLVLRSLVIGLVSVAITLVVLVVVRAQDIYRKA